MQDFWDYRGWNGDGNRGWRGHHNDLLLLLEEGDLDDLLRHRHKLCTPVAQLLSNVLRCGTQRQVRGEIEGKAGHAAEWYQWCKDAEGDKWQIIQRHMLATELELA